jgi:hypothetical protein
MMHFWLLFPALAILCSSSTQAEEVDTVTKCRALGFDPWQLSCETCDLLPEIVVSNCQACCQSYKTLEKRTHRYQGCVILHSFSPEIDTLLREDLDNILAQKGTDRLRVLNAGRGANMYHQPQPSAIMWFDELPPAGADINKLRENAKETIILDGWKRDDVRDMLLALLPDKK